MIRHLVIWTLGTAIALYGVLYLCAWWADRIIQRNKDGM